MDNSAKPLIDTMDAPATVEVAQAVLTESSRTHERLARLIASLQSAVLVEDENRRILVCNQAFCRFFLIPVSPEQLVGTDCSDSAEQSKKYFRDSETFAQRIGDILAAREIVLGEVVEMADGRVLERDYVPVFVGEEYLGHMWNYRDITESTRLRREIESRAVELARFGYVISHDLKAPLRGIDYFASVLNEDYGETLDDDGREIIQNIKDQAARMRAMIESLFKVAVAGGVEAQIEDVDSKSLVDEVLASLDGAMKADAVQARVTGEFPIWKCDRTSMSEVLRNIIENACKYNDKSAKIVEISAHQNVISIQDNGIGIPADKLDYIFEPLRRIDPLQQNTDGTGAGLAIVKRIVLQHGGQIRVASELGSWTRFEISLPAAEAIAA